MDPATLLTLITGAVQIANTLIGTAVSSGVMTPEQAAAAWTQSKSDWDAAYAAWVASTTAQSSAIAQEPGVPS